MSKYKRYCKNIENVENYKKALADNFVGWCLHHRLETWTSDGERRLANISVAELKSLGMYYNRPAEELLFMRVEDHISLHQKGKQGEFKGRHHSVKTKKRLSKARRGMTFSKEWRERMSEAHKGKHFSKETKKKMSDAKKAARDKTSKALKGRHWFNNGKENKFCYECPEGFVPGYIHKRPFVNGE